MRLLVIAARAAENNAPGKHKSKLRLPVSLSLSRIRWIVRFRKSFCPYASLETDSQCHLNPGTEVRKSIQAYWTQCRLVLSHSLYVYVDESSPTANTINLPLKLLAVELLQLQGLLLQAMDFSEEAQRVVSGCGQFACMLG